MSAAYTATTAPVAPGGKPFEGKVILVTGASAGIGEAVAYKLACDGAIVVLGARRMEKLKELVDKIKASGGQALAISLDVTDYSSCEAFVQQIKDTYGRLDGAFNNAGGGQPTGDFVEQTPEQFKKNFDLNFFGTYHMMKAELALMTEQKSGSIVNNLSLFASKVFTPSPDYTISKHAAKAATQVAAATVADSKVRVNSVSPGFTLPSESLGDFLEKNPEMKPKFMSPLGTMMDVEKDVYPAVAYLLSDASANLTGIDLPVAGGHNINTFSIS